MRRQIELWEEQQQRGRDVYPAIVATVDFDELEALDADLVDRLYVLLFGAPGGREVQSRPPAPAQSRPPAPTQSELVEAIRGIVCEVLRQKELSATRSLLNLGLSSITATQIAGRLSSLVGREVTPQVLFEHSTVAALAERFGA